MADYQAPLRDMGFVLKHVVDLGAVAALDGYGHAEGEVVEAVLGEAARLASAVMAPLNRTGDQQGSKLENGVVRTPDGFKEAYRQFTSGGWGAVSFPEEWGGGGMPWLVGMAVQEMFSAANMAFFLCPLLNQGAVELIEAHGTPAQKATWLPKMVSGAWSGTMNLTEPQAGSDVGALRTKAVRQADGSYRITGTKIFITYGEHDLTENIVHLVLARTPDAPSGSRGVSCFIVPKYRVNEDGSLGARNDLRCVSLEHKLGIHASPTCVMSFGDEGGAVGYLIGEENRGLRCMFTMMNVARLSVGFEGLAIAERAFQQAVNYARERRQGKPLGAAAPDAAIIAHADVRRMLMLMKSQIEAMRALLYLNAEAIDYARRHADAQVRARYQGLVELLTPVSKAWATDLGVELASLGVQVHGGMGFIEETGAAQHWRDSRIAPIYEGTNGIQALDLVLRKLPLEGGEVVGGFLADMRALGQALAGEGDADLAAIGQGLASALEDFAATTTWLQEAAARDANEAAAGASAYLRLFGITAGGYMLARGAAAAAKLRAGGENDPFLAAKIAIARFYAEQVLPQTRGLSGPIMRGAATLFAIAPDLLIA